MAYPTFTIPVRGGGHARGRRTPMEFFDGDLWIMNDLCGGTHNLVVLSLEIEPAGVADTIVLTADAPPDHDGTTTPDFARQTTIDKFCLYDKGMGSFLACGNRYVEPDGCFVGPIKYCAEKHILLPAVAALYEETQKTNSPEIIQVLRFEKTPAPDSQPAVMFDRKMCRGIAIEDCFDDGNLRTFMEYELRTERASRCFVSSLYVRGG